MIGSWIKFEEKLTWHDSHLSNTRNPLSSIAGTVRLAETFRKSSLVLDSPKSWKYGYDRLKTAVKRIRPLAILIRYGLYLILFAASNSSTAREGCENVSK